MLLTRCSFKRSMGQFRNWVPRELRTGHLTVRHDEEPMGRSCGELREVLQSNYSEFPNSCLVEQGVSDRDGHSDLLRLLQGRKTLSPSDLVRMRSCWRLRRSSEHGVLDRVCLGAMADSDDAFRNMRVILGLNSPYLEAMENLRKATELPAHIKDLRKMQDAILPSGLRSHLGAIDKIRKTTEIPGLSEMAAMSNALAPYSQVASALGLPKLYADIAAPWADLARVSERLLGRLEREGRFEDERKIWLPGDDEEPTEDLVGQLVVPVGEVLVELGSLHIRLMIALMRNPQDMRLLDDRQFELLVGELLASQGYREIQLTPRKSDGGKDIIAWRLIDGVPSVVYVECKHYPGAKPKIESVRALLGTIESDRIQRGIFVTSGRFTRGGREFIAKNSDRLDGKEYQDLVGWLQDY